jgi:hypothetical protein
MGIIGHQQVEEPIGCGPERIMKVLAHFIPHSLAEKDAGEKMNMGERLT